MPIERKGEVHTQKKMLNEIYELNTFMVSYIILIDLTPQIVLSWCEGNMSVINSITKLMMPSR